MLPNPKNRVCGLILSLLLLTLAASAESFDWSAAGQIAVQHGGRVKPLDTFARELVQQVYGSSSFEGQNPVETYFHWMSDGEKWAGEELFYIPKGPLREAMKLSQRHGNHFKMTDLQSNSGLMQLARDAQTADEAGEKLSFVQTKGNELLNRMGTLSAAFSHDVPRFVPTNGGDPNANWLDMPDVLGRFADSALVPDNAVVTDTLQALAIAFSGMYMSLRDDRPDIFNTSARVFLQMQAGLMEGQDVLRSQLKWESVLNALRPFHVAKWLLAGALLSFLLAYRAGWGRLRYIGMAAMTGGWLLFTTGMALRAYISGRAPWSNMYESLLAIGWALVLIALIYEWIRRDNMLAIVGSALGALILGVAHFASLDRGINQLVPALQSYWLNYHVIITLSSYACFTIAMGIGHVVLISAVRSKGTMTPSLQSFAKANLKIIQVGTLLLITGILLGAVWANVSWGRFWGWDPKETWALITWFVYIVFLHGRSAGWLGWRGLAAYSVGAFPIVIMTYYGVNFYLSGLHSYGAGSAPGLPWQLFVYTGIEGVFLYWAMSRLKGVMPVRPKKPQSKIEIPNLPKTSAEAH